MTDLIPSREEFFFPLEQHFNKFFDNFFGANPVSSVKSQTGYPKMDAVEEGGKWKLHVACSGMTVDDVAVEITPERILTVSGRMSEEFGSPDGATYYLKELRHSAFRRSIKLPDHVKGDPDAVMKDGILTLSWDTVPGHDPGYAIRKIPIKGPRKYMSSEDVMKSMPDLREKK